MDAYRKDFPTINQSINDNKLVYLDSAASSQMPTSVIDEIARYQMNDHANVHRGIHTLSHRATTVYEKTRQDVSDFINAKNTNEIIFTSGTTESINLVAQSYCRPKLNKSKKILISHLEHHSNIVPWQIVCEQTQSSLEIAPINNKGEIITEDLINMIDESVVLVSISHVSNALGSVSEVKKIVQAAHKNGVPVLVDGAQSIPHMKVDVQELNADFYVFSGHKMHAPTGTGILYGKEDLLEKMPPYKSGGDMILEVKFTGTTYNDLPYKFEAGTPNIADSIGLGVACEYLNNVGMDNIWEHEMELGQYAVDQISKLKNFQILGNKSKELIGGVVSFIHDSIHPHDIGSLLDGFGIAIRTGHHCAMPLVRSYGVVAASRASFYLYNKKEEIDKLIDGLKKVEEYFK